ncbi:MAG: hypothetical protein J4F41_08920, partial [Alphaproteobacteria bacterium]|nr:hypothetical protein [Alphaproteobacteria bacterium]
MSFSSAYTAASHDQAPAVTVIDWAIGDAPLSNGDFATANGNFATANGNFATANGNFAAAIGNFDGVHRGHQALISAAVTGAKDSGLMPAVITFSPHPRRFFNPGADGFALTDERDKIDFLAALGVTTVIRLTF